MALIIPGVCRAQVVFQGSSGKPEDRYVNTFHFEQNGGAGPITDATRNEIGTRLIAFYNTAGGSGNPLSKYISSEVLRTSGSSQIRMYDLGDAEPRPVVVSNWTLGAVTDPGRLPGECAIVGSFYGTRNLPRQRGRIFVGPLNLNALAQNTARPHAGFIAALVEQMHLLANPTGGAPLAEWVVLSTVAGAHMHQVTDGWCDDSFDTQRRRGIASSARSTFTSP